MKEQGNHSRVFYWFNKSHFNGFFQPNTNAFLSKNFQRLFYPEKCFYLEWLRVHFIPSFTHKFVQLLWNPIVNFAKIRICIHKSTYKWTIWIENSISWHWLHYFKHQKWHQYQFEMFNNVAENCVRKICETSISWASS